MTTKLGKALLIEMDVIDQDTQDAKSREELVGINRWVDEAIASIVTNLPKKSDELSLGLVSCRSTETIGDIERRKIAALGERLGIPLTATHVTVTTCDDPVGYMWIKRAQLRQLLEKS